MVIVTHTCDRPRCMKVTTTTAPTGCHTLEPEGWVTLTSHGGSRIYCSIHCALSDLQGAL